MPSASKNFVRANGEYAIATLATWMMTLFIQRSEHRDTQAIHAKLDELLRSDPKPETPVEGLPLEEKPQDTVGADDKECWGCAASVPSCVK
jgi:low affinity Fe/Cu permease